MHAAVLVLAASTVLAPWTARNLSVHGRFVLVAAEGGVTFWTGNHPAAVGEGDLAANPQLKAFNQAFREQHSGLTAEALEPHYYAESWRYIRAHPLDWLALEGRKLFYLFVPVGPSYLLHSPLYYWASVLPWLLLLPLAIAGYLQMVRLRRVPRALLAHVLATIAVCVIFFPQERFRIPILDPAAIVGAAALADLLLRGLVRPGKRRSPPLHGPVDRILLLRLERIGDLLMALRAIGEVRRRH